MENNSFSPINISNIPQITKNSPLLNLRNIQSLIKKESSLKNIAITLRDNTIPQIETNINTFIQNKISIAERIHNSIPNTPSLSFKFITNPSSIYKDETPNLYNIITFISTNNNFLYKIISNCLTQNEREICIEQSNL